jgi:hypothetical protein
MMPKKPGGSFGEMGQGKKIPISGKKNQNFTFKKNTDRGNWYQCGCGFTLGDYFQSK